MTPLIPLSESGSDGKQPKLLPYKSNRCQLILKLIRKWITLLALYVKNLAIETKTTPYVEMIGFEPTTPAMQTQCSPNWATSPYNIRYETFII